MVAAHIPPQQGSAHKRPRCQSTPPPSDSDPEDNNRHEDPDSDNVGGSAPQHRDPQVDPEIETLDQRSCTPIHFRVMREMERVILGESERLNRPANTEPANRPANPEPATPARFIFSAVTKKAFLRHDIDSYTRGSFKDGTRDKSLLTITIALLAQVREIQKRVRLSIREKLFTNMLDADGNTIEDRIVPNVHKLAKSIFCFLEPAEVSMTQPQVREVISMLYIARIGHLQLQTLQHLLSPAIKRISQWDLINNKIQELNSKSSDYRAAWSKAITAREALLFGQQRSFNKLDEAIISIPTNEEVQAVLDEHQSQVAGPSSSTHPA
ncbi:hypothetical protein PCASD_09412 [Puccinia coronata f. sp. avenae]|uniref:Uncharacterized protein n=1 Tax=Puccinia coronata f. sp. avenae TaxID=200324 RepID=A0A2N5UHP5_9BASI|nr:hypothetical protein PCASD_09412 [Puccinia coronata f. sp. avenae]